ncbi:MAG TPA: ester cyclase [Steroidobacteraceae bacterium]|jgi:predicted SnoaL-like aldol condensation-catalyzing enzyme|nr:ester cyclase [Steroidobacteraceae bacterium]
MKYAVTGLCALVCVLALATSAHAETAQEARNKQIAIAFYNAALNEKNWDKARTYIGPRYVQHSIYMEDGPAGLEDLVKRIKKQFPDNRGEIKLAFADGDIVVLYLHVTRTRQDPGWAVIEMMRLKNDKVVEHWDDLQRIPKAAAGKNPIF